MVMAGVANRPHFGGNWNNGSKCGSRGSNWNNSPLNLNSNIGARGVAETKGLTLRLAISARPYGRIHNGGLVGLVAPAKARRGILK